MKNTHILSPHHPLIVPFQLPLQTFQHKGLAGSWQSNNLAGEGARVGDKSKLNMKNKEKGTIISIHHLQSCVSNVDGGN